MHTTIHLCLLALLGSLLSSTSAHAATFKCFSKDVEEQERPYELEISTDPVGVKFSAFYKEEDGRWASDTEVLADSTSVLKPIPIQWSSCQISKVSTNREFNLSWKYKTTGSGHLNIDLQKGSGEFYSSYQFGGNLLRLVRFYGCKKLN